MKRYAIYGAVCLAMLISIAIAGFFGPLLVGMALEVMARRAKRCKM